MPKKSRDKGKRREREIAKLLTDFGFPARRYAPMQAGRASGEPDVMAVGLGKIEVKARKDGFKTLHSWLSGNDFLVLMADRQAPLVVMPLREFLENWAKYGQKV